MNGNKKKSKKKKIEWDFTPTLGHEIKSKLTKKEFDEIFTRLSEPTQEQSGQEKKETSA